MKKILLICGTGASSGFIASNVRKAAKERGLDYEIIARSDSALDDYIEDVSLLLVAPHLSYMLGEVEDTAKDYNVPVKMIPKEYYGTMNGEAIVDLIQENIG